MRKKYNTPKRDRYIRARLTSEEKADFDERLAASGLSQSDFIRQAVFHSKINLTIRTECSIEQMERIIAEYGKIGSNLNQIARHLNGWDCHKSYRGRSQKCRLRPCRFKI